MYNIFSFTNTSDYESLNQDRLNDVFQDPDEDNRTSSIPNIFNNIIDNSTKEKYSKTSIEINNSNQNSIEIKEASFSENNSSIKKNKNTKFGRKRRCENQKGKHTKFSDDNLRRKIKHITLQPTFIFINGKIKELYNNNIGNGNSKKQLLKSNKNQKFKSNVKHDQELLYKSLGDIFSDDISGKYSKYDKQHNKLLIEELKNENDFEKRIYFKKLFSLTFLQCLKHFRGEESIKELEGMKLFNENKNELNIKDDDDGDNYKRTLETYINNFENIINGKRPRKSNQKTKKK